MGVVFGFWLASAAAGNLVVVGEEVAPAGYLARLELNTAEEVESALKRADHLFLNGSVPSHAPPVVLVLYGPQVSMFFRENYARYKPVIDLAARLSALEVIDIKVCETRMGILGRDKSALLPFVGTVPYGPREVQRLVEEKRYVYF